MAGIFWKKQAVCAGYAGAAQYLLEYLNVPCIYVEGKTAGSTEGHAWNIITLEGEYYYFDATNGDQPEFLGRRCRSACRTQNDPVRLPVPVSRRI